MLRRHASLIVALVLLALVTAACVVRTRPPSQRPVYVETHGHGKHKKQKKHKKHDKHRKHHH
jgi:hypothetical protein